MLVVLTTLSLLAFQNPALRLHPTDPLHRVAELEVGEDGIRVEYVTEVSGWLSIWASSESVNPRLVVEVRGRDGFYQDDDSGGGSTAWLAIDIEAEKELQIHVSSAANSGVVELHVLASRETDATRAEAKRAAAELDNIKRLRTEDELEEARIRVGVLVEQLAGMAGARESWAIGESLWLAGIEAFRLGAIAPNDTAWTIALTTRGRFLPPDHSDVLIAKANLAVVRQWLGDLEASLSLGEALLAAYERLLPPDHPDLLSAKSNLASTLGRMGNYVRQLALRESVHAARERLLPPDHPDLLAAKHNLALALREYGDLSGARALSEIVHAAYERLFPPEHPDLLKAKGSLGLARVEFGDLAGAQVLFEAVHVGLERLLPPDHPELLNAMANLAVTRAELGDLEGALALDEAVHQARCRFLPPDDLLLLASQHNLAATRRQLGDLSGALRLGEELLAARERILPPDHPDVLAAKLVLGSTRFELEDFEGAHALFEVVFEAQKRLLPPDHPAVLDAELCLAATRAQLGDLPGALALEEAVHARRERLLPPGHPDLLLVKQNLADTRLTLGDLAGAQELTREIAGALASVAAEAMTSAPREARVRGGRIIQQLAEVRFWSETKDVELAELVFEVLETVRHAVSAPLRTRLGELQRGEAGELLARLRRAEWELDRLISSGPEPPSKVGPAAAPAREDAGRSWREAIRTAALRRDGAQRLLLSMTEKRSVVRVAAPQVARALGAKKIAVGITRIDRWRLNEARTTRVNEGPHYLTQIVLPGGELFELDLGPAESLDELVQAWRRALGAPIERGVEASSMRAVTEVDAGRALRQALVDPILDAVGSLEPGTTIYLCLDDALFTVPVEALPLDESEDVDARELSSEPVSGDVARLGDRYRVRYEISFARLLRPAPPFAGPVLVVAAGEVDFDAALDRELLADSAPLYRRSAWGRWDRLSATGAEVSELAYQAKEHLGVEARVLRRDEVTEGALAQAVRGARYVHLATHGFFIPSTERKSMLDDEPGGTEPGSGSRALLGNRTTITGFAPETLCGLVLSGANSGKTDAERSACLLTAQELGNFDLRACDLAVLSACETNVGITRAGQGIQSLQSALHRAGARTSITSLWAVQDWPTQSLMKRFYDNLWGKGMGKADALWEAKRALRNEGHPPYVWAGWVLMGDPD